MEDVGLLDPADEIHIWCLQYVYQPRIDHHLQLFLEGWNRKPIRTANNKSPTRLWFSGLYAIANSQYTIAYELQQDEVQVIFNIVISAITGHKLYYFYLQ